MNLMVVMQCMSYQIGPKWNMPDSEEGEGIENGKDEDFGGLSGG